LDRVVKVYDRRPSQSKRKLVAMLHIPTAFRQNPSQAFSAPKVPKGAAPWDHLVMRIALRGRGGVVKISVSY